MLGDEGRAVGESLNFLHKRDIIKVKMSDYKQLVKIMFNSWTKTHELSARIVDAQIRRNNIKRLEGNYRVIGMRCSVSFMK